MYGAPQQQVVYAQQPVMVDQYGTPVAVPQVSVQVAQPPVNGLAAPGQNGAPVLDFRAPQERGTRGSESVQDVDHWAWSECEGPPLRRGNPRRANSPPFRLSRPPLLCASANAPLSSLHVVLRGAHTVRRLRVLQQRVRGEDGVGEAVRGARLRH